VRTAAAAPTPFLDWLVGQRLQYSIGFTLPTDFAATLEHIPDPEDVWTEAYDADGKLRPGAHVAEVTDLLDLQRQGWPAEMRAIVRREKPHRGAQLRLTGAADERSRSGEANARCPLGAHP